MVVPMSQLHKGSIFYLLFPFLPYLRRVKLFAFLRLPLLLPSLPFWMFSLLPFSFFFMSSILSSVLVSSWQDKSLLVSPPVPLNPLLYFPSLPSSLNACPPLSLPPSLFLPLPPFLPIFSSGSFPPFSALFSSLLSSIHLFPYFLF